MAMRLGIALEGGGARCAAQAGALLALHEMGIRPSLYAGCGAGALVAALAACDMLSEEAIRPFAKAARWHAASRTRIINRRLRAQFGAIPLKDARPLAMPTIDMQSGAVQVLSSMLPTRPDPRPWSRQSLASTAVRCAMAAPGVLPPVAWRAHRLCGGGHLRGTLPTILRAMGADQMVCIRVLDAGCAQYETHPAALALCAHAMVAMPPSAYDMIISVEGYAPHVGVLDTRTVSALFEAGRAAAIRALPSLELLTGNKAGKIVLFPSAEPALP